MSHVSPKGSLPHGWIVKTSRNYPDRVYYFNLITGASVWECPELDPPRVLSKEEEVSKESTMENKVLPVCNRPNAEDSSQNSEKSVKPCTPPTAVVVPVVHKKKEIIAVLDSQKKLKKRKQIKSIEENSKKPKISKLKGENSKKKKKKKKKVSPLNKSNPEEPDVDGEVDVKGPSTKKLKVQVGGDADPRPSSSSESNVKDVEMRDVSMDLIDDLTEKKETVFDTTACYYIVVDTNVLIGEINLVSELKDTPLDGCGPPHIFIPWIVIEELDKLKKGQRSTKGAPRAAGEAIRFLNSVLGKHPRFHGQSPAEAEKWAKTYSRCNDDKILECCVALQDKMPAEKVILLTNDKNLVNKALICKINVHNFESMMKKVKPDTVFNYEEMKMGKKRKKEKNNEESKSPSLSSDTYEERVLQIKRDTCKRQIHTIMSNARLLLKGVLCKFLSDEMFKAYGKTWFNFKIELKLLKGILEGVRKYWIAVFSLFFTEKDKRNIELLLEKATRPEGFFGDKDECLVILSAIEDIFRQIQRRQPKLKVPVEQIQDYRVACVSAFIVYCEAESSIRTAEEKSILTLLNTNWTAINQLCGMILDYYDVPHSFKYEKLSQPFSDLEIRRIMTLLYPNVQQLKTLLCSVNNAVKNCKPVRVLIKKLSNALLDFIPSLRIPHESITYPFFSQTAMERFFICPQNREMIEVGVEQIEGFYKKLDELLLVMLSLKDKSPAPEAMICD